MQMRTDGRLGFAKQSSQLVFPVVGQINFDVRKWVFQDDLVRTKQDRYDLQSFPQISRFLIFDQKKLMDFQIKFNE